MVSKEVLTSASIEVATSMVTAGKVLLVDMVASVITTTSSLLGEATAETISAEASEYHTSAT
jgi:hypothetical protein